MSDIISRQDALDAVNDCGICIQKILDIPSAEPERIAKVRDKKDDPMVDEWHHGRCMNCGKQVRRKDNYCSRCGGRLEWE